jgi:hypothetical protein
MDYLPVVHINGTGKKTLTEEYQNTYNLLVDLKDAFNKQEFHARDYYVEGHEYWKGAVDKRNEIKMKMNEIEKYLLDHLLHLTE